MRRFLGISLFALVMSALTYLLMMDSRNRMERGSQELNLIYLPLPESKQAQ